MSIDSYSPLNGRTPPSEMTKCQKVQYLFDFFARLNNKTSNEKPVKNNNLLKKKVFDNQLNLF